MALAADFSAFMNDQLPSRNMDFSLDITCWGNLKMILDIHITIHISCNRHPSPEISPLIVPCMTSLLRECTVPSKIRSSPIKPTSFSLKFDGELMVAELSDVKSFIRIETFDRQHRV